MPFIVLVRGGGDIASGVALRLHRAGLNVVITELPHPMVVRRLVAFAEAVFAGEVIVEGVLARKVNSPQAALEILPEGIIPVLIDPLAQSRSILKPAVLVDGRMTKQPPDLDMRAAPLVIGLGPGFTAGVDCHAVVETNRGHLLGRVIWEGSPQADTGTPEVVCGHGAERVLRSPSDGIFEGCVKIGEILQVGQCVARVSSQPVLAPITGVVRGLLVSGTEVRQGVKIGDMDPRLDPSFSRLVSDKALAVGGAVLEAILSRAELRSNIYG
jgi:xanthine dehydrogenase accessory factor